jgi:hypothetical protein
LMVQSIPGDDNRVEASKSMGLSVAESGN